MQVATSTGLNTIIIISTVLKKMTNIKFNGQLNLMPYRLRLVQWFLDTLNLVGRKTKIEAMKLHAWACPGHLYFWCLYRLYNTSEEKYKSAIMHVSYRHTWTC